MPTDTRFGEFLATLVRRQGLSMADFAARIGQSASTLSRVRTGLRKPRPEQVARWADALQLGPDDRAQFLDLALLELTPPEVRVRLTQAEQVATSEQSKRVRLENDFGAYRKGQRFHDGWWLSYSASFVDDGRIQRSLLHIDGDGVSMQVHEAGQVHYSYHGTVEVLADKVFIRMAEDRGGVEYVQITLDSLFDWSEPSFLYGLVCGISGKSVHHPLSFPACSRILLLHVAAAQGEAQAPEELTELLGCFAPAELSPCWPKLLGNDTYLRRCLGIGGEPLDAAVLRMVDNHITGSSSVLRASVAAAPIAHGAAGAPGAAAACPATPALATA
jgi:transcriptional regulator with XRE-family HTH domain